MAANPLVLRPNLSHVGDVPIKDLGLVVPAGGTLTVNSERGLLAARRSRHLQTLLHDDAYGAGSSTLIANDGTNDIPQSEVESALDVWTLPRTTKWAPVLAGGTVPFSAPVAGVAPTLPAHLTTKQWVEDQLLGGGITEVQHEALDTLVHDLAEDSYLEILRTDGRVSSLIWWTDSSKTTRIRDVIVTRTSGRISQVVTRQYDDSGVLITGQTLTETVTRTNGRISSVQSVES